MRLLVNVGKFLALSPLLAWGCSSGEPTPTPSEPVSETHEALAWGATANNMTSARVDHAATPLNDANGRVLVCGGRSSSSGWLATCDIYNPTTNSWAAGTAMGEARAYPTLTTLGPSSVLVAGGFDGSSSLGSGRLGTGSAAWGAAEVFTNARSQHTASILSNGTVVLTGGTNGATVSGADKRSSAGAWTAAGTQARQQHAAAVLSSGTQIFVTGGQNGSTTLDTTATYTFSGNSWATSTAMVVSSVSSARKRHTATLLPDGSVLIAGGQGQLTSDLPTTAIRYNPAGAGTWSNAGTITARFDHAAALVGGLVVIAGGQDASGPIASVQVYNPDTNTWTTLEPLGSARARFTLSPLSGGKLLAAGGVSGSGSTYLDTAEVFSAIPQGNSCTAGSDTQCITGHCVDGVCCDTTCSGTCQACAESGLTGTCSSVSGTPRGSRSACSGGYLCVSGACPSTCTGDGQCQSTHYCTTGMPRTCATKKVQGATCGATTECVSGLSCADGVCCESSCSGQCQHCNGSGLCVPTSGTPVAPRSGCGAGAGTTCGPKCDGITTSSCTYSNTETSCQAASCTAGHALLATFCDGAGSCTEGEQDCPPYVCNAGGTACRTTCSQNSHCSAGYYCAGSTCEQLLDNGVDCTAGTQCDSGNCVNSVCCGSASCSSGSSCATPDHRGECRRNIGTSCSSDNQCGSDQCADGVCCNADCSGQCERCDAPSNVGTCVATNGAPVGSRDACGGAGSGTDCGARCDGVNREACEFPGLAQTCGDATCDNGLFTTVSHCTDEGLCPDTSDDCIAYTCNDTGTACRTSCSDGDHCLESYVCDGGICVEIPGIGKECTENAGCESDHCVDGHCCGSASCPDDSSCGLEGHLGTCKKERGAECAKNAECGTGHCVDGFCCNSACENQCAACDNEGREGTCSPFIGAPHGTRAACEDAGGDCGAQCDGTHSDACAFPDAGAACGDKSCKNGVETRIGTCDGEGECSSPTRDCEAFVCNKQGTACNTACSKATDCAGDYFCSDGECIPNLKEGRDCETNDACASGHCTDGVCCGAASCGDGSTCAFSGHRGECTKDDGSECSEDDDCGSGHCIDGVCCNEACDGQCEACDVSDREGSCSPVSGEPHGGRESCGEGDGLCGVMTCNGAKDRSECVGYANGADVECGAASCEGSDLKPAASCDGAGSCRVPDTTSCLPFRCSGSACLFACETKTDCAEGYQCRENDCVAEVATCSADRKKSVPVDGPETECAPYLCASDGTCATDCQTSSDCGAGNACDTSVSPGVCKSVKGGASSLADDGGGCGCAVPHRSSEQRSYWLLATAACAVALRRRRTRVATSNGRSSRSASGTGRDRLGSTEGTV